MSAAELSCWGSTGAGWRGEKWASRQSFAAQVQMAIEVWGGFGGERGCLVYCWRRVKQGELDELKRGKWKRGREASVFERGE